MWQWNYCDVLFFFRLTQDFVADRLGYSDFSRLSRADFSHMAIKQVDLGNTQCFQSLTRYICEIFPVVVVCSKVDLCIPFSLNLEHNGLMAFEGLTALPNLKVHLMSCGATIAVCRFVYLLVCLSAFCYLLSSCLSNSVFCLCLSSLLSSFASIWWSAVLSIYASDHLFIHIAGSGVASAHFFLFFLFLFFCNCREGDLSVRGSIVLVPISSQ